MNGLTLDAVRPLVSDARTTGRTLLVTFRCPVSGKTVQGRWSAPQASGVGSAVANQAKRSAWYEARRQVNSLIRGVFGHGSMGAIATNVANTAMGGMDPVSSASRPTGLSAAEQEQGILEAFQGVAGQFAWVGNRWVHKSSAKDLMSPFDAQLAAHPVAGGYDRQILARMLIEVASSHGGMGEEEQVFLSDVLAPELGSLDALRKRPPLTEAELGETTAGEARVSLLSLVWSVALCDEHLDAAETAVLERYARQLGMSSTQATKARDLARGYLLDQLIERMFTWGGHDESGREQLYALGERIGMGRADVERAEARYQKRKG